MAAEILRALYQGSGHRASGRGGGRGKAGDKDEWRCGTCSTKNFADRVRCRKCGRPKPRQPATADTTKAASAPVAPQRVRESRAGQRDPATGPQAASQHGRSPPAGARPPAPEAASAAAEARALALEQSAAQLRAVGLDVEADNLQSQAGEQRRRAESGPPPGKRLDLLEAYVSRAVGRFDRATNQVNEAEVALAEARSYCELMKKELDEGRSKLAQLRSELASSSNGGDAGSVGIVEGPGVGAPASLEEEVRGLLEALEGTRQLVCPASGLPPEAIASRMAALHVRLGHREILAAKMDEAISDDIRHAQAGAGKRCLEAEGVAAEREDCESMTDGLTAASAEKTDTTAPKKARHAESILNSISKLGTMDDASYAAAVRRCMERECPY